jgi:hypothetical protein
MRSLIARLYSWWHGKTVGQVRYIKASPFIIGNMSHFMPSDCWSKDERDQLRYCCHKERWDGLAWRYVVTLEMTREELRAAIEEMKS